MIVEQGKRRWKISNITDNIQKLPEITFFRVLGEIKSFGSAKLGKFYWVGRVTLNRSTFFGLKVTESLLDKQKKAKTSTKGTLTAKFSTRFEKDLCSQNDYKDQTLVFRFLPFERV